MQLPILKSQLDTRFSTANHLSTDFLRIYCYQENMPSLFQLQEGGGHFGQTQEETAQHIFDSMFPAHIAEALCNNKKVVPECRCNTLQYTATHCNILQHPVYQSKGGV